MRKGHLKTHYSTGEKHPCSECGWVLPRSCLLIAAVRVGHRFHCYICTKYVDSSWIVKQTGFTLTFIGGGYAPVRLHICIFSNWTQHQMAKLRHLEVPKFQSSHNLNLHALWHHQYTELVPSAEALNGSYICLKLWISSQASSEAAPGIRSWNTLYPPIGQSCSTDWDLWDTSIAYHSPNWGGAEQWARLTKVKVSSCVLAAIRGV